MKIQRKQGKKAEGEISQLVKPGSWKSEGTGNRQGQKQTGNWIFYQGRDWQGRSKAGKVETIWQRMHTNPRLWSRNERLSFIGWCLISQPVTGASEYPDRHHERKTRWQTLESNVDGSTEASHSAAFLDLIWLSFKADKLNADVTMF